MEVRRIEGDSGSESEGRARSGPIGVILVVTWFRQLGAGAVQF